MTLEAAMVVPLFLFVILNLFAAINFIALHVRMETAMHQTGLQLAKTGYAYHKIADGCEILESEIADIGFSMFYVKQKVEESVGETYLDRIGISGGAQGVSFLQSDIVDPEYLDLVAVYHTRALFLPESFCSFQMVNRVRMKVWTGYDNTVNSGSADEEHIVYITENGEVYHESRECSHLRLQISQVSYGELSELRNENGAVYYPCERCGGYDGQGTVYITEDGTRYHTTLSCAALKRSVTEIPISEVGDRRACSRCGNAQ